MTNSISFGAKPLKKVQITKYYLKKIPANIVEIDPTSKTDFNAVNQAVDSWNMDTYGFRIRDNIKYNFGQSYYNPQKRVLALTTQQDGFQELQDSKILGLMQISKINRGYFINYLQVKPNTNYHNIFRKYKDIGKRLIEYLQAQYKHLVLNSDSRAVKFYKRLGFIETNKQKHSFYWIKKHKDN